VSVRAPATGHDPEAAAAAVLVADPADAGPSPVPGMTLGEFRAADADIRWFSRLSYADKVRAWRRARARIDEARRANERPDDGG